MSEKTEKAIAKREEETRKRLGIKTTKSTKKK